MRICVYTYIRMGSYMPALAGRNGELLGLNGGYFLPIHLAAALSGRGKRLRPNGEGEG